jgi:hypothetical protein
MLRIGGGWVITGERLGGIVEPGFRMLCGKTTV